MMGVKASEIECLLLSQNAEIERLRAVNADLLAALKAMNDFHGPRPKKIDCKKTWLANRALVRDMVHAAIARAEESKC